VMNETLSRSSIGELKNGSNVNLERAMSANGRFGGHIVSGHIDGTGKISAIKKDDIAIWYTLKTNSKIMRYIIEKGSISLNGISLTIFNVTTDSFMVAIIPYTYEYTNMQYLETGDEINIEFDMIGKYVTRFLQLKKV